MSKYRKQGIEIAKPYMKDGLIVGTEEELDKFRAEMKENRNRIWEPGSDEDVADLEHRLKLSKDIQKSRQQKAMRNNLTGRKSCLK